MAGLDNLKKKDDVFANRDGEADADAQQVKKKGRGDIHIRMQQRNGRKCITTLQGLDERLDFDRMKKEFKRRWGCNGTVITDPEAGTVIQLQGDQREHLTDFLLSEKLAKADQIKTHGL